MDSPPKCLHGKCKQIDQEMIIKAAHFMGPSVEAKFDEFTYEIAHKIDKELNESEKSRIYIAQKYEELCDKIQYLTSELDATVIGFRNDVKGVKMQISKLTNRIDDIEKKTICKEWPSLSSSMF